MYKKKEESFIIEQLICICFVMNRYCQTQMVYIVVFRFISNLELIHPHVFNWIYCRFNLT